MIWFHLNAKPVAVYLSILKITNNQKNIIIKVWLSESNYELWSENKYELWPESKNELWSESKYEFSLKVNLNYGLKANENWDLKANTNWGLKANTNWGLIVNMNSGLLTLHNFAKGPLRTSATQFDLYPHILSRIFRSILI